MMYELALFAGAGGGLLATQHLFKWKTVCYVENASYPVQVLTARIKDGLLDDAPIWDDVRTFRHDNPDCGSFIERLAGLPDLIITAGFPCQPFAAGGKEQGENDPRNMWPEIIRIIREIKPRWIFLENSPNLLQISRKRRRPAYIGQIIGELAQSGYVGCWGCLSAAALGFEHKRERVWIIAHSSDERRKIILRSDCENGHENHAKKAIETITLDAVWSRLSRLEQRLGQPSVFGIDDGMAHRVDRLAAVGEGQVPAVVARVWQMLTEEL